MVDVVGNDRAAARDLVADELGRDVVGDGGAEILAIARGAQRRFAAEILADRDIFHFRSDDSAPRVMHLADVGAGAGAEDALADVGEGLDSA